MLFQMDAIKYLRNSHHGKSTLFSHLIAETLFNFFLFLAKHFYEMRRKSFRK